MRVRINTAIRQPTYIVPVKWALEYVAERYSCIVEETKAIPAGSIFIDDKPVALLAYGDAPGLRPEDEAVLASGYFPLIFKWQYDNQENYIRKDGAKVIPAGYLMSSHCVSPDDYLPKDEDEFVYKDRIYDISARFSFTHPWCKGRDWALAREKLQVNAVAMSNRGLHVLANKVSKAEYLTDLSNCKLALNWRGFGMLNFKVAEYIWAGAVMLTMPYGSRYPLVNNVTLEDGVNCVFINSPEEAEQKIMVLISDSKRIEEYRCNICRLWNDNFSLPVLGDFYFRHILEVLHGQ